MTEFIPRALLVTGGAGFIGSNFIHHFLRAQPGCRVINLDLLTYAGNLANLDPVAGRYEFVHGDICDPALLGEVLPGYDAVVNCAAETHVDRSIVDAATFVTTNVTGVQVLLEACMTVGVPGCERGAPSCATASPRPASCGAVQVSSSTSTPAARTASASRAAAVL